MKTQQGFTAMFAMIFLGVVTLVSVGVQAMLASSDKGKKASKIHYEFVLTEQVVKTELSEPFSYQTCSQTPQVNPPHTLEWSSCNLSGATVLHYQNARPIVGAKCATPPCGVKTTLQFVPDVSKPKYKVTLSYTGSEVHVSDYVFDVDVPKESLQGSSGICGVDKNGDGIVDGYLYKGNDDCRALPSCGAGTFFRGLDAVGNARCDNLTTGIAGVSASACPADSYLNQVLFDPTNNQAIQFSCNNRIDICVLAAASCPLKTYP